MELVMASGVLLRDVTDDALPTFYEQQLDPVANHMAAFTAEDPADQDAFAAHWAKIRGDDTVIIRTMVSEGTVVGHIAKFERDGDAEVTYWIGKPHWGKGLATAALTQFLTEVSARPLYARAAKDNVASIRVLEKCGFAIAAHERGFAIARGQEIDEVVLKLEAAPTDC
ncbi:MAG: GNAT family N-acetyltransferase [bacterium]|nr:GNAT family N-acetyltransferase [bacterium]